ncbi:NAD-binding protein, partial [Streptomyces rimosus]|uniref:NAD-binding protein n=1 Tax=Streptomyces rimosus TaxID=1927 RepID=UPI0004CA857D
VKAANQLIVAVNLQACAEAVVFLEKSGVDLGAALDVLNGGLAGSTVLTRKKTNFQTASLVAALRAQGDGGLDHSALLRGVERLSGHTTA